MQLQTMPPIQQLTFGSPKHHPKTPTHSFRTDIQKFSQTQNSQDDDLNHQKFTKTHFKNKFNDLNHSKYSAFQDHKSGSNNKCLQRIEQKLRQYALCSDKDKKFLLTRSQLFKLPELTTTKSNRYRNPTGGQIDQQREGSQELDTSPLTLKKRINIIKKHKELKQKQFQQRKASLEYNERALSKESYRLHCYKSKFQKVKTVRQQRSRERIENSMEIQIQNEELMRRNYFLKETVLGSQENLKNSRVSLCMEKLKLANETRIQKHYNMEEVRSFENQTLKNKKLQCEQVKNTKARTHQSVDQCYQKRIITVNQRKLHEISKQLVSLESQKKMHNTFYRMNEVNDSYQNKIKNKKIQLQQKAKVYKTNLMLELNRSQRISMKNQQEEQKTQGRNSSNTEPYAKKRNSMQISVATDINFASTKSNCIYKRWNNPIIAERLHTDPSA